MGVPWVEVSQDYLAQGYLDKPAGCSPGTQWRPPRRAGPRCGARGLCRSSCGRGSPARSPESRTTRGPRRPSPRSPRAGRCPRCAADPPPGLRVGGLASATGLSSEPCRPELRSGSQPRPWPRPPRSAPGKRGGRWGGWDGLYRLCHRFPSCLRGRFGSPSSSCQTAGRGGRAGARGT